MECPEDDEEYDILSDLAYDLDFYQPVEWKRAGEVCYYGDDRLMVEIRTALKALGS